MDERRTLDSEAVDLAVVGGGPAGVALVLSARSLHPDWRIAWCRGATRRFLPAYDGNSAVHRLNVPVERMGLNPDAPVDFLDWLQQRHPDRAVVPGQFVPRLWFGDYLRERVAAAAIHECTGAVRALQGDGAGWRVEFSDSQPPLRARRVALALGLPASLPVSAAPPCWVGDAWAWWRALPADGLPLQPADEVLIVGSGLTAVDMVLGLRDRGFAGRVRVVSPSGRWSLPHAPIAALADDARSALDAALDRAATARTLLRVLRDFAMHYPWRAVIDALRAGTNARWAALPQREQQRVLRHLFGHWNRHRHRMAPDVAERLAGDKALTLERGRIRITADGRLERHGAFAIEALSPALALDCRGPGFAAALRGDSLLARLVRDGVLQPHPLGTGIATPADATLQVVGAATFGERFETASVPELRAQARDAIQAFGASQSRGTR